MAGKAKMKDWKAAVRNWKRRDHNFNGNVKKMRPENPLTCPVCDCGNNELKEFVHNGELARCMRCKTLYELEGNVWKKSE